MPVSYDDVEERRLGRQAKIAKLADQQLEESFADEDRRLAAEEQTLNEKTDSALTEDALAFIDQMNQVQDDGGDPMQVFEQLPPELQDRVAQLLSAPQDNSMEQFQPLPMNPNNPNPGQPMMDGSGQGRGIGRQMMAQGQAMPQQQPVNITEQAKQIAALQ